MLSFINNFTKFNFFSWNNTKASIFLHFQVHNNVKLCLSIKNILVKKLLHLFLK